MQRSGAQNGKAHERKLEDEWVLAKIGNSSTIYHRFHSRGEYR